MHNITVDNVNDALSDGLWWLHTAGVRQLSRNGAVLVSPVPVCTTYKSPQRRVMLHPARDANPFFHLFEALWMLAGRNDVAYVAHYAKQMAEYSDDGATLNGAYGHRWRYWWAYDQLDWIVAELVRDPTTRRCVLSMWSAEHDPAAAAAHSKDVPCNTHAYFDTTDGKLNMTVCCRSNDVVWGAYGANAVHFSVLLEYLAARAKLPMGVYRQLSNNYHLYVARPDVARLYTVHGPVTLPCRPYPAGGVPLRSVSHALWMADLRRYFDEWDADALTHYHAKNFKDPFFATVALPMARAHRAYKAGAYGLAFADANAIAAPDWHLAVCEWLERRKLRVN